MTFNTPESVFVAASAFLFVKMLFNSFVQGYARFRATGFRYPEDTFLDPKNVDESYKERLSRLEHRATAAWRNDLENIPMFLVAAYCGLISHIPMESYQSLVLAFCLARAFHTVALLVGRQPWRFLFFLAGVSVTLTLFLWSLKLQGLAY